MEGVRRKWQGVYLSLCYAKEGKGHLIEAFQEESESKFTKCCMTKSIMNKLKEQ